MIFWIKILCFNFILILCALIIYKSCSQLNQILRKSSHLVYWLNFQHSLLANPPHFPDFDWTQFLRESFRGPESWRRNLRHFCSSSPWLPVERYCNFPTPRDLWRKSASSPHRRENSNFPHFTFRLFVFVSGKLSCVKKITTLLIRQSDKNQHISLHEYFQNCCNLKDLVS